MDALTRLNSNHQLVPAVWRLNRRTYFKKGNSVKKSWYGHQATEPSALHFRVRKVMKTRSLFSFEPRELRTVGNTEVFARRDSTVRIFSQLSDWQRKNGEDSVKYLKQKISVWKTDVMWRGLHRNLKRKISEVPSLSPFLSLVNTCNGQRNFVEFDGTEITGSKAYLIYKFVHKCSCRNTVKIIILFTILSF